MNLNLFLNLVRGGEKSTVDFKLVCNAFNRNVGDQEKAKAELVKDLCAMANNGVETSYLIIGVGDDRKSVQSVSDANLCSQNVQSLVRDSLHPRPVVRFHRIKWDDAPHPFGGIVFVIIQVGPNARHAFRLARDLINWGHKFHFRRHEVWVRNEDTSDLATPEQIARLLGPQRKAQIEPEPNFKVVEYQKLARKDQLLALSHDVQTVFVDKGVNLELLPPEDNDLAEHQGYFRVQLKIRGKYYVFRCVFLDRLASNDEHSFGLSHCWMCEHGVLVFVIGSFTSAGKFKRLSVDSKTRWGALGLLAPKKHGWFRSDLPRSFAETSFTILTLPKLSDTKRVRESLAQLFDDLENDEALFNHLNQAGGIMSTELRRWSKKTPTAVAKQFPVILGVDSERAATFSRQVTSVLKLMRARQKKG